MNRFPVYIPRDAVWLLQTLRGAGHTAYVVGGCVRDSLLGRTPGDWDICTSAKPEEVPLASYDVPGKVMPSSDFDIAADGTLSLYKAMEVQSVTTNKATAYEIGTEVTGLELSWALNKAPSTLLGGCVLAARTAAISAVSTL